MMRGWNTGQAPRGSFIKNPYSWQSNHLTGWWVAGASHGANVLLDHSGHGRRGNFSGTSVDPAWLVDGEMGPVLDFDGTNDYLDIPAPASFGSQITVACWIKHDGAWDTSLSERIITQSRNGTGGTCPFLLLMQTNARKFEFSFYDGRWRRASSGATPPIDAWTHVAGTYDGVWLRVYIDGLMKKEVRHNRPLPATNGRAISLAASSDWDASGAIRWMDGKIAEARMYSVGFSPGQVAQLAAPDTRWELYYMLGGSRAAQINRSNVPALSHWMRRAS